MTVADPAGTAPAAPESVIPPSAMVMGDQPVVPHTVSVHEDVIRQPGAPVDVVHHSVSETRPITPGEATMANVPPVTAAGTAPPGTVVGDAPAAPGTVANIPTGNSKPAKQVWDTNHPKPHAPATTMANVPTTPAAASPATTVPNVAPTADPAAGATPLAVPPAGGASNVLPATVVPSAPAGSGGVVPVLPTADPSKGSRKSVRWDSHIPGKDVVGPPSKTPPK